LNRDKSFPGIGNDADLTVKATLRGLSSGSLNLHAWERVVSWLWMINVLAGAWP